MAYRGTRAATVGAVAERDEDPLRMNARQGGASRAGSAAAAAPVAVDDLLRRFIALDIVDEGATSSEGGRRRIQTVPQLKRELEEICRTISEKLGRQQSEGAYQRALQIELELGGVTVQPEAKVTVTYRGKNISSRRVDLLLTVGDGSAVILEIKALQTITKGANLNAVHQLQYYLDAFGVDHGFLVNFPHDAGFPPPPNGGVFRQEPICGVKGPLPDRSVGGRRGSVCDGPEIVYFQRV